LPRTSSYARFSIQIHTTCRIGGGFVQPHGPAARLVVGDGLGVAVAVALGTGVTTGVGEAPGGELRGAAGAEQDAAIDTTTIALTRLPADRITSR
jgi:serine acetyltransferase